MTPDLQDFLERYRDAFNALDGDAVAALYAEPAGIAQDGRYTHWPDRAAVAANMRQLCALYRDRGFVRAAFECRSWLPLGAHDAVVDLTWCIDWQGPQPPWRFATAYHLMRGAAGWRVQLCIAHDEAQLWRREPAAGDAGHGPPPLIAPLRDHASADWLRLRMALCPGSEPREHLDEMASLTADQQRHAPFIARTAEGMAVGLAEASLRSDCVPGTATSPVAFLEGLYVEPSARRRGVARALVAAVEAWARERGCTELASDTPIDNLPSQRVHTRLGFAETARLACFCKRLSPPKAAVTAGQNGP